MNTGDTPDYSNSLIFSWTQPVIDVKQFSDWWLAIPCDIKRSDICWVIFSVLSSNPFRISSRFWGQLSWFSSHSSKFLDGFTKNCQNWANSTKFLTQLGKRKLSWQNRWKNNPDFLALLSVRLFSILFFSWFSSVYSFDDLFKCRKPLGCSPVARVVCSQCYYFQHLYSGHKRPNFGAKMVSNFGQNEPNFPFPKAFFIFSIKMKQSDLTLHFHIFYQNEAKWPNLCQKNPV